MIATPEAYQLSNVSQRILSSGRYLLLSICDQVWMFVVCLQKDAHTKRNLMDSLNKRTHSWFCFSTIERHNSRIPRRAIPKPIESSLLCGSHTFCQILPPFSSRHPFNTVTFQSRRGKSKRNKGSCSTIFDVKGRRLICLIYWQITPVLPPSSFFLFTTPKKDPQHLLPVSWKPSCCRPTNWHLLKLL